MKRELLEGLGISKEAIDQIMAENGADIENARASERSKFDTERSQLQTQVSDLQTQLKQRDEDLAGIQNQLTAAQADAGQLAEAQKQLTALQTKYDRASKDYEAKTAAQAREYAVRVAAAGLKFSSASAKRAFIHDALADKGVKLDGNALLGYNDFLETYKTNDPGAFVQEQKDPEPEPDPEPAPTIVLPGKSTPPRKTMSLQEMMKQKNANPNFVVNFGK